LRLLSALAPLLKLARGPSLTAQIIPLSPLTACPEIQIQIVPLLPLQHQHEPPKLTIYKARASKGHVSYRHHQSCVFTFCVFDEPPLSRHVSQRARPTHYLLLRCVSPFFDATEHSSPPPDLEHDESSYPSAPYVVPANYPTYVT
jgi:hypothetical protein